MEKSLKRCLPGYFASFDQPGGCLKNNQLWTIESSGVTAYWFCHSFLAVLLSDSTIFSSKGMDILHFDLKWHLHEKGT